VSTGWAMVVYIEVYVKLKNFAKNVVCPVENVVSVLEVVTLYVK